MYSYYKGTYKYSKSQNKADWKSLNEIHKNSDPLLLDLLRGCLQINPGKRFTVEDCLNKEVFFDMRDQCIEKVANTHIELKVDFQKDD